MLSLPAILLRLDRLFVRPALARRVLPAGVLAVGVSAAVVLAGGVAAGCGARSGDREAIPQDAAETNLVGTWRAVLGSPGGELPFTLEIRKGEGTNGLEASAVNGEERAPFSRVEVQGDRLVLSTEWYDSEIEARVEGNGQRLEGSWRKTQKDGDSGLSFSAERGEHRFPALDRPVHLEGETVASVDGRWTVRLTDEDGTTPAIALFDQRDEQVEGTFLTPTGDYRFLAGDFDGEILRLSTFDGAHAFLFRARLNADGSLSGDFWSRDTYHATWIAERAKDDAQLPDPFARVGLSNDEGRFSFRFEDLEGTVVSLEDPRFRGKVVVVDIFGSWCPNCNDGAPTLVRWSREHRARGLEVVGLAFEMTGDVERDRRQVARYAARHEIDYPLLLAGTSDKKLASQALPDLSAVLAFPTKVFVDRRGKVRGIYSGIDGPATGEANRKMLDELERLLEGLLAEGPPPSTG